MCVIQSILFVQMNHPFSNLITGKCLNRTCSIMSSPMNILKNTFLNFIDVYINILRYGSPQICNLYQIVNAQSTIRLTLCIKLAHICKWKVVILFLYGNCYLIFLICMSTLSIINSKKLAFRLSDVLITTKHSIKYLSRYDEVFFDVDNIFTKRRVFV